MAPSLITNLELVDLPSIARRFTGRLSWTKSKSLISSRSNNTSRIPLTKTATIQVNRSPLPDMLCRIHICKKHKSLNSAKSSFCRQKRRSHSSTITRFWTDCTPSCRTTRPQIRRVAILFRTSSQTMDIRSDQGRTKSHQSQSNRNREPTRPSQLATCCQINLHHQRCNSYSYRWPNNLQKRSLVTRVQRHKA